MALVHRLTVIIESKSVISIFIRSSYDKRLRMKSYVFHQWQETSSLIPQFQSPKIERLQLIR
jgi:hypothetical protein